MKNLANLVGKIPGKIGLGFLGVGLYTLVSCATMTEAQETALLGQTLMILGAQDNSGKGELAVVGGSLLSNYGQMQHDIEVAKAGKDEIIINNNVNTENQKLQEKEISNSLEQRESTNRSPLILEQKQIVDNSLSYKENVINEDNFIPKGIFAYNEWVDKNGNGMWDGKELRGLGKKVFNLDEESICVGLHVPDKVGKVNFMIYTEKEELIGVTADPYQTMKGNLLRFDFNNYNILGGVSFIDRIRERGPGKYKIRAIFEDKETFTLDFEVIK